MHDRSTPAARPAGPQPGGSARRVEHLHFDRRARVWRTHAELILEHSLTAAADVEPLKASG